MALFRRRHGAAMPGTERASVAVSPARTVPVTPATGLPGVQGWAGLGTAHPSAYQGAYSGTPLTQRGSSSPGLQLRCGVESLSSGWCVAPSPASQGTPLLPAPLPWMATQRASNDPGAQRTQGAPSGGMGPITARAMRANITRAQILQSGLAATQWARSMNPTSGA